MLMDFDMLIEKSACFNHEGFFLPAQQHKSRFTTKVIGR